MAPLGADEAFTKTPEGFLKGRAILTSTGVFPYKDATGKVRRELRLPEEVFHPDHLESLKLKPITLEHPSEEVRPENAAQYQVGHLGSDLRTLDNHHLSCDAVITHEDGIKAIEGGKRSLSCGYTCDLEQGDAGASHEGMPYDYIQRNIRGNHVAIVDKARAGDAPRIRLDSADAVQVEEENYMRADPLTISLNPFVPDYQLRLAILKRNAELDGGQSDDEVARARMSQRMRTDSRENQVSESVPHFDENAEYDAEAARERMIKRLHADGRAYQGTTAANITEAIAELGITRPAPLRGAIAHELRKR
jgi:hypothetical protein